jgi:hypothetical protein
MDNVEIRLVTNNASAVKGIREVAAESQKLHTNTERQQKRQIGLIADIEKELANLQTAQKNAMTIEHIEKYNKKIAEAKKNLEAYNKAGVESEKQTSSLSQTIGKWVVGLGLATVALRAVKDAVLATTHGMNAFNIAAATGKQMMYNLVTGSSDLTKGLKGVIEAQKELNRLRIQDKVDTYNAKIELLQFNIALIKAKDQTKSVTERIAEYDKAIEHKRKATEIEIKSTEDQIAAYEKIRKESPKNEDALMKIIELETRLIDLRINQTSALKEISSMRSGLLKKERQDMFDRWFAEIETENKAYAEKLKAQKKYLDLSQKLLDEYERSNIDSLTGAEKLRAIRDFGLKQIRELMIILSEAGKITAEQDEMFTKLGENVIKSYKEGMKKEAKIPLKDKEAISKALLAGLPIKEGIQEYGGVAPTGMEEFSVWKLLGIDPDDDEGKRAIDNLKSATAEVFKIIDDTYQKRVDDAERTRSLLDTRISEAQSALESEIRLHEAGYASNIAAKQKEIEMLKAQREKALKEEEKAIKAQRQMDAIMQASSLLTASANIIKGFSKLPLIGQILSIAAIGAMFAAFAAARVQASKITKLAAGGHGEVTGRLHSQGGERFSDHIEVEQGERWGVLNRSASRKYGTVFNKMVDSFNKDNLSVGKGLNINNISIQNEGPNKRLDEVNSNLRQIRSKEEIIVLNGMTVYKKGNSVRVIKK